MLPTASSGEPPAADRHPPDRVKGKAYRIAGVGLRFREIKAKPVVRLQMYRGVVQLHANAGSP